MAFSVTLRLFWHYDALKSKVYWLETDIRKMNGALWIVRHADKSCVYSGFDIGYEESSADVTYNPMFTQVWGTPMQSETDDSLYEYFTRYLGFVADSWFFYDVTEIIVQKIDSIAHMKAILNGETPKKSWFV